MYPVAAILILAWPCASFLHRYQQEQQRQPSQLQRATFRTGIFHSRSHVTGTPASALCGKAKTGRSADVGGGHRHEQNDNEIGMIHRFLKSSRHRRNVFQGSYNMEQLCDTFPDLTPFIRAGHVQQDDIRSTTINFHDPQAVRTLNAALLAHDYGIDRWQEFLPSSSLTPPIPGRADYIHHIADVLSSSASSSLSSSSERVDATVVPTTAATSTTSTTELQLEQQLQDANVHGHNNGLPYGRTIRGLDIGTGASLIFPLLGTRLYGWTFVASETDPVSLQVATQIAEAAAATSTRSGETTMTTTDDVGPTIDVRQQPDKKRILQGILRLEEELDFCMCNPPFYESEQAYQKENDRKMRNLQKNYEKRNTPRSRKSQTATIPVGQPTSSSSSLSSTGSNNFSGGASELWYPGGEVAFIAILIQESHAVAHRCLWFSSLVSRRDHLPTLQTMLSRLPGVKETRIIEMNQGQKSSNLLFWTFHDRTEQAQWCIRRKWQFARPTPVIDPVFDK